MGDVIKEEATIRPFLFASFPSISFFNINWFWFEGESGVLGVREEEEEEEDEEEQPIRWLEDICRKKKLGDT